VPPIVNGIRSWPKIATGKRFDGEWFWKQTRAGKMILDFQEAARVADDRNLRTISGSLVPAERTYEYLKYTDQYL